ncbi:sulfotransferase [Nostoc sp. ChiQUE01b]|uniref:sulfotransferase family protein n=1 Tax=Nostoc sp. ChiQUE01b TaxID=3075376 RepID=UPI002AD4F662|nr:sulfotransferase [Nostoc sp. ChiQUE01b]MDZ8258126.1 sulfotransferase [Nostoc sp. ChiQUE01b]
MNIKTIKEKTPKSLRSLAGFSFVNWIKLLISNRGVDPNYIFVAIMTSLFSFLFIPIRLYEKLFYQKQLEQLTIEYPPIFIVGHWRSGTTYLHNIIIQDKNLGYVSIAQVSAPGMFLSLGNKKIWKITVDILMPQTRPMDNIHFSSDLPQEEEFAMGNLSPYSFYHGFSFPKNIKEYFKKYILFDGLSEEIKSKWKNVYLNILKKATFEFNGKRLVLKNPPNTGRIEILLQMFPDAKFIHIYRNPYIVYSSTKHLYKKLLPTLTFQNLNEEETEAVIIEFYHQMMQKFFNDKNLIPPNNFIEIKYEDFVDNEIIELKRIYEYFNLPGFDEYEENFKKYIESQKHYIKNQYSLNEETINNVYNAWKFTIDKWQYSPPK